MAKKVKGIIQNWSWCGPKTHPCICGVLLAREQDAVDIRTSSVVRIFKSERFGEMLETRNSVYILGAKAPAPEPF